MFPIWTFEPNFKFIIPVKITESEKIEYSDQFMQKIILRGKKLIIPLRKNVRKQFYTENSSNQLRRKLKEMRTFNENKF